MAACVGNVQPDDNERIQIYTAHTLLPSAVIAAELPPQPPPEVLPETSYNQSQPFPGRIAIFTESWGWGGFGGEYFSAKWLVDKHGAQNIFHNSRWTGSRHSLELTAQSVINDPEIRVVIINSAKRGVNYFVSLIREQRNDIFIIYIEYDSYGYCDYPYISQTFSQGVAMADLILNVDMDAMYTAFPMQAQKLGAETIVFFAVEPGPCYCCGDFFFDDFDYEERNIMRVKSEQLGLNFVEAFRCHGAIGCMSDTARYMSENIPKWINKYGRNIAFAGLCDERLLWDFRNTGVVYPSSLTMIPSPQFIALGLFIPSFLAMERELSMDISNLPFIIAETRKALAERDMLGRISTWPVHASALLTYAAVEYGIRWMNGEVPSTDIDLAVLEQIMVNFIAAYSGEEGLGVRLTQRSHDGNTYPNYILFFMDFMIY